MTVSGKMTKMTVLGSEFGNFSSADYSKFAVERDWNRKISQIRTIFFLEKNGKGGKFAVECVSNDIIS